MQVTLIGLSFQDLLRRRYGIPQKGVGKEDRKNGRMGGVQLRLRRRRRSQPAVSDAGVQVQVFRHDRHQRLSFAEAVETLAQAQGRENHLLLPRAEIPGNFRPGRKW